jgi:GNAT superfamily N-acetyltransferase
MTELLIRRAESDFDITRCYPVLRELRPHLSPKTFVQTVRGMQQKGYVLVLAEAHSQVVAVAGYRFSEHLARGPSMYIDDLVTVAAHQRKGLGGRLLAWLVATAKGAGCEQVHLDSGVQRTDAHAFYEKEGMQFSGKHFSLKLT